MRSFRGNGWHGSSMERSNCPRDDPRHGQPRERGKRYIHRKVMYSDAERHSVAGEDVWSKISRQVNQRLPGQSPNRLHNKSAVRAKPRRAAPKFGCKKTMPGFSSESHPLLQLLRWRRKYPFSGSLETADSELMSWCLESESIIGLY
jgi:hypothetical protein